MATCDGDAGDNEVVLAGKRVLAGDGRVIAPWTERVRYTTGKSAGYHGGATPQEMLVPAAVFAPAGRRYRDTGRGTRHSRVVG